MNFQGIGPHKTVFLSIGGKILYSGELKPSSVERWQRLGNLPSASNTPSAALSILHSLIISRDRNPMILRCAGSRISMASAFANLPMSVQG
jgi:hypothetical protein